jgi:hypothetical protein
MIEKIDAKHWFFIFVCVFVGVFIIFLFLIPDILSERKSGEEDIEYNYFKFKKVGPVWETLVINNEKLLQPSFRFLPEDVENVPVSGKLNSDFGNDVIYLTFDPLGDPVEFQTMAIAVSEMGLNLVKGLEKEIEAGCTRFEAESCENKTIVDCSSSGVSVIFFNPVGEPEVILKDNCIELKGKGFDLVKSVDRVLYSWYGILKKSIISPKVQAQS